MDIEILDEEVIDITTEMKTDFLRGDKGEKGEKRRSRTKRS